MPVACFNMFTQPSHCCCCFDLRTGTLILATLGVLANLGYVVAFILAARHSGISPAFLYTSASLTFICFLLNLWFLVGAAKVSFNWQLISRENMVRLDTLAYSSCSKSSLSL
ncbi:hypothetical protein DSO57_1000951 [Entomophthora muscae]|uniref:Uncharacterized protein n=1 Tax=Entomophthora muscae TaxID=34485 RepID=A0ACC2TKW6_9FUNG|nr:hypothetical protein DSO57_1000951 [Entomophthora muscae]